MSKLISSDKLKKLINPDYLSEDTNTIFFESSKIIEYSSEPKVEVENDIMKRFITLTALYIVPKKYVYRSDNKGYLVIKHHSTVSEMFLSGEYNAKEFLVNLGRQLQQDILTHFADYDFTSFKYVNVPNRMEVIDLEKLDKV
jgi:hypothetical protein